MNYDLFTSVPEPKINISLFGDAASQGAKVGTAIPTTTTAVIQGLQQGISQGLDWQTQAENIETANIQQEAARQRLPYEGAMAEARAEDARLTNELNQLKVESTLANKTEKQNLEKATLETASTELDVKKQTLQRETEFLNSFKNAAPEQQMEMVFGGKYTDVFGRNKNIWEQAIDTLYLNPKLPEEQREYIDAIRKRSQALSYYDKEAIKNAEKFAETKNKVMESDTTGQVLAQTNDLLPEDLPEKVEFVPTGRYEAADETYTQFKINPKTGSRIAKEGFSPETWSDKYFITLKGSNKILGIATKDDKKLYEDYLHQRNYQNGTYGRLAADRVTPKKEQAQGKGQQRQTALPGGTPVPGVQQPAQQQTPQAQLIQETLQLNPEQAVQLQAPLQQLEKLSQQFAGKRFTKSSLSNVKELTQVKDNIAHYIVKQEWDSSEAVRSRFTAAEVRAYNNQIDKQMTATLGLSAIMTGGSSSAGLLAAERLAAPLKVKTPEELYYVQRREVIDKNVNDLFKNMVDLQKQQASTKARSAQATQNTLRFLEAIRYGAQPAKR